MTIDFSGEISPEELAFLEKLIEEKDDNAQVIIVKDEYPSSNHDVGLRVAAYIGDYRYLNESDNKKRVIDPDAPEVKDGPLDDDSVFIVVSGDGIAKKIVEGLREKYPMKFSSCGIVDKAALEMAEIRAAMASGIPLEDEPPQPDELQPI
ncbi:MAG: hypothetical protein KAJ29_04055 [Alphaproteobacteria bacterium]|nr:hypothetical protein [Alphaproteobacteria bacterium]